MKIPVVDLHAQYMSIKSEIDEAITRVIRESAFVRGEVVASFEENFATAIGAQRCVSCGNGTDALYIAMKGLGVKPGDEVITTAHSWISSSETISQTGAVPVFCDTDENTFTIDTRQLEHHITPRTVGIIPVHLFGQSADMDEVMRIARKFGLWVIEDCAQAHLAQYKGRNVGTFGTAATFSFYPGKNLGAMGDAGAIVTDDSDLANWCSLFAQHGGKGSHSIEGINSRLDGIQAAILSAKLPFLSGWNERRRAVAATYDRLLSDVPGLRLPEVADHRLHAFHLYVIRTEKRDALKDELARKGIATSINYPTALPFLPCYLNRGFKSDDYPRAFENQQRILSIPMYPELLPEQVQQVAFEIKDAIARI